MPDNGGDCSFYSDGNLTVFETPWPPGYFDDMSCEQNFTCSDPDHVVYYQFERFQTEFCCDHLYVDGNSYSGDLTWGTEWIETESSTVDMRFRSDASVTLRGFKMNFKCGMPSTCFFEEFENSAVFDTGDPYMDEMRQGFSHLI